jgi:hypothetical protein
MSLSSEHLLQLTNAKAMLGGNDLSETISTVLGKRVDSGYARLPEDWRTQTALIAHDTIMLGLRGMLMTLGGVSPDIFPSLPRFAAAISARNLMAEIPGLALELPVSMMMLCRSIADIACANAERSDSTDTRLACLELFALGDARKNATTGYFAEREALQKTTASAMHYMSEALMVDEDTPPLREYVAAIAARFREQIEIHVAAQAVPNIDVHSGSAVNLLLIDHFQDIARGHFTVRRLERTYGQHEVRTTYDRICLDKVNRVAA